MIQVVILALAILPTRILAEHNPVSLQVLKQSAEVQVTGPAVVLERAREVHAKIADTLSLIAKDEAKGNLFSDMKLLQALKNREVALHDEIDRGAVPGAEGLGLVQLDNDELLAQYARELLASGDKQRAIRRLLGQGGVLASSWVLRSESDAKILSLPSKVQSAVQQRNSLFDTYGEPELSPEQLAALDTERLAYLDRHVAAVPAPTATAMAKRSSLAMPSPFGGTIKAKP